MAYVLQLLGIFITNNGFKRITTGFIANFPACEHFSGLAFANVTIMFPIYSFAVYWEHHCLAAGSSQP